MHPELRRSRRGLAIAVALWLPACAGLSPDAPPNLLINPGFEEGRQGWNPGGWEPTPDPVRSGEMAARLVIRPGEWGRNGPRGIFGVVQEFGADAFPESIAGWYRADRWHNPSPATALYIQVVVVVWSEAAEPVDGARNRQLRYLLAGASSPPYDISNAKYLTMSPDDPVPERWTRFELPVREDFDRLWGGIPGSWEKVSVLFEARWDHRTDDAALDALVYLDDLVVSPASLAASSR